MTSNFGQTAREQARATVPHPGRCAIALLCAPALASLALCSPPPASARRVVVHLAAVSPVPAPKEPVSATLEQCVDAPAQEARSVTFSGEMAAIPGTVRMQISIQLLERLPGEPSFRLVESPALSPALSAWRSSEPAVKGYKLMRQFTDLAAPASYRAAVRFRWLGPHGRVLAAAELRTRRCGVSGLG